MLSNLKNHSKIFFLILITSLLLSVITHIFIKEKFIVKYLGYSKVGYNENIDEPLIINEIINTLIEEIKHSSKKNELYRKILEIKFLPIGARYNQPRDKYEKKYFYLELHITDTFELENIEKIFMDYINSNQFLKQKYLNAFEVLNNLEKDYLILSEKILLNKSFDINQTYLDLGNKCISLINYITNINEIKYKILQEKNSLSIISIYRLGKIQHKEKINFLYIFLTISISITVLYFIYKFSKKVNIN